MRLRAGVQGKPDPRIKARHPGASPLWEWREEGKRCNSLPTLGRVLFCIQHSQLRIKRKCISGSKHFCPELHRCGVAGVRVKDRYFIRK